MFDWLSFYPNSFECDTNWNKNNEFLMHISEIILIGLIDVDVNITLKRWFIINVYKITKINYKNNFTIQKIIQELK